MIKNNKNFNSCFKAGGVLFCVFVAAIFAVFSTSIAQAQTAMVTKVSTNFIDEGATFSSPYYMCGDTDPSNLVDVSYMTTNGGYANDNLTAWDPWNNSALIEFDQYITSSNNDRHYYPNNCLRLCSTVTCANPARKTEGSTGNGNSINTYYDVASSDFPIQSVLFEVFKYQPGSNPYNADTTPPVRTIALTPTNNNVCKGVPVCTGTNSGELKAKSCCYFWNANPNQQSQWVYEGVNCWSTCNTIRSLFDTKEDCEAGMTHLDFCAGWDGSYEIDGEFGKSNGQFGFRANIQTKWPGDGISSGDVEVNHTMAYPGVVSGQSGVNNYNAVAQIPIQVDVTNVHSVRSSSTMVGTTTKVPAQPYQLTYKLSKDATTTVKIMDPGASCKCSHSFDQTTGSVYSYQCATSALDSPSENIEFDLIEEQPRLGEGIPNGTTTNLENWDGRDDHGNLLPYGNYLVSVQAATQDEWGRKIDTGKEHVPDISRAVTRQISLDPLQITDIKETGLAKLSTSYAKIDYVLTEAATVHVMIFTPGTYFTSVEMQPGLGLTPNADKILAAAKAGTLVAHITEQKQARANVNTKWDGVCRNENNCVLGTSGNIITYKYGTPMPDGDYVYVMWAEIPYAYANTGLTSNPTRQYAICVNGNWWLGVATHKYYNGILPINRGLPEITVGAVGYSSIGSSPTAYGLDPFTFTYSVSRDSIVDATIKTTAVNLDPNEPQQVYEVKHLLTNEVAVANKANTFSWDGIDNNGYQVAPGTYMIEFVAKDSLYPDKQATTTVQFPVDLFRVVNVNTTPLLDEATSQATISYTLSKSMDVTVEIYDTNITIPTDDANWCQDIDDPDNPGNPAVPLKTFILPKAGEGMTITEVWDGLQHSTAGQSVEPLPDGNYPYRICTQTTQPVAQYYGDNNGNPVAQDGAQNAAIISATDKPSGFITIARGSIAFTKVLITPSQPALKYSTETIYLPAYEIGFSTSRPATVNIEVISTQADQCMLDPNNPVPAGTVCRALSTYAFDTLNTGYFDPTKIYKVYWDGKDSKGEYVKYGSYEIRLTGLPYPVPSSYTPAQLDKIAQVFSQVVSVNNFQVYDRYVEDITRENPNAKFAYQISVPMKVAIQIFKPGTTTNRDTGTAKASGIVNPVGTGTAAQVSKGTIQDVLVKSIVGVRPNLVSLDEVWDGTDYAGQEVPDGIYPYRYVTVMNAYDMDSVTGELNFDPTNPATPDNLTTAGKLVADWEKYITLEHINVARGDSWYADVDWKSSKVTSFYPNPFKGSEGWFEIAKLPAPGKISIKIYNIAGDLVRSGGYTCVNAKGETDTLENIDSENLYGGMGVQPYINLNNAYDPNSPFNATKLSRNFTLRCRWDKTNDHGKQVARGLYYAIMELNPTRGNSKKSQRVIKILIP